MTGCHQSHYSNIAQYVTVQTFVKALRPLVVENWSRSFSTKAAGYLKRHPPTFPTTLPALKTSTTWSRFGNEFEKLAFAKSSKKPGR